MTETSIAVVLHSGGRPHQREDAGRGRVAGGRGGPGGQPVPRGHADAREAAGRHHGRLHLAAQVGGLHTKQRSVLLQFPIICRARDEVLLLAASKGFFTSFARTKPNFRIPRSASMRTPSPPPSSSGFDYQRSPPPMKTLASASTSLTALSRDTTVPRVSKFHEISTAEASLK